MKKLIFISMLLLFNMVNAQTIREYLKDDYFKKTLPKASFVFAAGMCDGQVETLSHHYGSFKQRFPNTNDQYWNPDISWKNKYKNLDPNQGNAYLFSKNGLVWTTDAYHLFRTANKTFMCAAISINISEAKRKKLKHYLVDIGYYSIIYTAGFYSTYKILY